MCLVLLALLALTGVEAFADGKLTGTVIGTLECVDYGNTSKMTTTVNTRANAFDGNLSTFFATWERSYTWAGLDLGSPHVITRVGWSPRNDSQGEGRVVLGVFEGANSPDFMDALPLYLIDEKGKIGQFSYADVNCSRGFRYVRYVGPADARCNIAELEFYGYPGEGPVAPPSPSFLLASTSFVKVRLPRKSPSGNISSVGFTTARPLPAAGQPSLSRCLLS